MPTANGPRHGLESQAARLGLLFFVLYFLLYAGFMALAVVSPLAMGARLGPTNVAISYGFLLIVVALALAVVYMRRCRRDEESAGKAS